MKKLIVAREKRGLPRFEARGGVKFVWGIVCSVKIKLQMEHFRNKHCSACVVPKL